MVKPSLGLSGSSGTRWMKMVWLSKTKQGWLLKGIEKKKGFDYDETIAHVARLESIRIFLAYAAYMSFMVYQIDVKSAFLNGKLFEEVYVQQPPRFESSKFPNYVCKLDKALYGLNKLDEHDLLKKYDLVHCASMKCPMLPLKNLGLDESEVSINETKFRGMIGSLMYLTTGKPDTQFSTFVYARKSTLGGFQILGEKLVCWSEKKQNSVAMSSVEDMLLLLGVVLKSSGSKVSWLIMISCMKSENLVSLPKKESVRAGLATLRLVDEKNPDLSSTDLVNSSSLKIRYFSPIWRVLMLHVVKCLGGMKGSHDQLNINQQVIAYSLIWGLNVDIGNILFSDLVSKLLNGKKGREPNVCYIRFLSLIIEHFLGNAYNNDKLKTFKPHHISATSFKTPSANEVALIPHMLKLANISIKPEQTLILPSKEVNDVNTTDKSLSGTTLRHVGQPKASNYKKLGKKKIPSSFKPKTSKNAKQSNPKKTVNDTQHAEESVTTADATKSLETSELAEELRNHPNPADSKKGQRTGDPNLHYKFTFSTNYFMQEHVTLVEEAVEDPLVTNSRIRSLGNVNIDQAVNMEAEENKEEADSDLESMPDDEIMSVSGNEDEEADSDR
ncbi:uncharacterized mitochondrial protein-like protein [Tanacetum coccineum]